MKDEKKEKGSISLFVIVAILMFVIVLFSIYFNLKNKGSGQKREVQKIQEEYNVTSEELERKYEEVKSNG